MSIGNDLWYTGKAIWLGFLAILVIVILSAVLLVTKPAFLWGDRIITKTSFQYTEGKAQEMLTLYSDWTGLGSRIAGSTDPNLINSLTLQRQAIKIQMCNMAQIATTSDAVPEPVRFVCGR
jgi:hypothetical protein